jgi:uncharacterized protein YjgD (DUF1641 family)
MESNENQKESTCTDMVKFTRDQIDTGDDHFFSVMDLPKKDNKITDIFRKHKTKFSKDNKALFIHPPGYLYETNEKEYFYCFKYETEIPLSQNNQHNFVYDCLNFICYKDDLEFEPKDYSEPAYNQQEYLDKITNLYSLLNEKGTLMILIDVYYIQKFFDILIKALGPGFSTKLFINFYFAEKHDFLFIITIQKMSKVDTPINLYETKVLITDFFSNLRSYVMCSKSIQEFRIFFEQCLQKMKNYYTQCKLNYGLLKVLHPGKFFEMRIKSSPLTPGVDHLVTITDNSTNVDSKNKKTVAIVILYEMTQELTYQSNISFDLMTQNLNVGRIIALQCAILNPMNMNEIAFELRDDIEMMKPDGFNAKIPIQGWEDNNPKYLVYQGDNYLIRDCEEKPECFYRQLFYTTDNRLLNAIMAKIKIKFMSKSKIKNKQKEFGIYPMETQDKFLNKGVIKCIDENDIPGFYEKIVICMSFYLNLGQFPKNTIKIMDIGAGIGTMSFYFTKLFKGNCEVDNIEKNKWIYDLGIKFFGLKNYDKHGNRINWFIEDAQTCLDKMISSHNNDKNVDNKYENKIGFYDLIFNDVNDIIPKDFCSPSASFFTDKYLDSIKKLLKKNGVYIANIQSRNFKILYENYLQLAKHFPTRYLIPTESSLTYVFICFNDVLNNEKYGELFKRNKEIIFKNDAIDSTLLEPFYKDVITKIKEEEQSDIKKMEDNSKKL